MLGPGPTDPVRAGLLPTVRRAERSARLLLIRTAQRRGEGWVYGVGSGIVWDSVAAAELAELRLKLGAFLTGPRRGSRRR